ncbi:unnamed protein product, partial [Laminaria digitata]
SDHQNLSLPGKAEVSVDVVAPGHFLVDLKSKLSSERGGDEAGGDGGARRLKEFLTSLEQGDKMLVDIEKMAQNLPAPSPPGPSSLHTR